MAEFIQLHILTSYPPSNPNRDDLGRPKTARMGGVERLRISSQSLKRAWRTSEIFEEKVGGSVGVRTKFLGVKAYEKLVSKGVKEAKALEWAKDIASVFGKCKGKHKENKTQELEIEQLVHVSPQEQKAIDELLDVLISEERKPEKEELELLRKEIEAVDIALFGRMLASSPKYNVEAAAQVAHAITVNQVVIEDDYFTAVDDLNNSEEDSGSSHIGESAFGSGVFYVYACINKTELIKNLNGNLELANKALAAFAEAACTVGPSGKQNSFANRVRASYALVEKGSQQPRSLAVAFLNPVRGQNQLGDAINALETEIENTDKVYGKSSDASCSFNVKEAKGSLAEVLEFIAS